MLFTTHLLVDVTVPGFVGPATNLGFPAPIGALVATGGNLTIAVEGFSAEFQLTSSETLQLQIFAVPEPGSLMGLGLACVLALPFRYRS